MKVTLIAVDDLKIGGSNVREMVSEAEEASLKESIRQNGVVVPLLVAEGENGLEVLDGGRRLRAALSCGLSKVPVVVLDKTASVGAASAWVANFERANVPFVDESRWMGRAISAWAQTPEHLAVALNRSAGYVRSRLAVLEWPPVLLAYCSSGSISYSVAREYARLGESPELELALDWDKINAPSYRQAVAYVDEILRQRELTIPPEAVSVVPVAAPCVCSACGGPRDVRDFEIWQVCRACVEAVRGSVPVLTLTAEKPKAEGRPRRGRGGQDSSALGKADFLSKEAAPEA